MQPRYGPRYAYTVCKCIHILTTGRAYTTIFRYCNIAISSFNTSQEINNLGIKSDFFSTFKASKLL